MTELNRFNILIINFLRVCLLIIIISTTSYNKANSQDIVVNSANNTFGDKSIKGYVVCLELDVKSVEKNWNKFLKSFGKFENTSKQTLQGQNLMVPSIASDAIDFFSRLVVSPRCIEVFMGALRAGSNLELLDVQAENVKKMLYNFAVEQYKQDITSQISEAERVVNLAVRAHDKRVNEGNNIKNKISKNHKDRSKLAKELEENAKQLTRLKADSTKNVAEQETALDEINKVRKIAEERKQKLSQVK
jgi:hypothetical protein